MREITIFAIYTEKYIDYLKDYSFFTELIIVDNSITKKKIFEKNSDLFIAFPGGVGTLDEIVDIINRNNKITQGTVKTLLIFWHFVCFLLRELSFLRILLFGIIRVLLPFFSSTVAMRDL